MIEKIKNWLKENWLNFLINFIGVYIILFFVFDILFELQIPSLLHTYTNEELRIYISEISLRVQHQHDFLFYFLPFSAFFITIGIYLIKFRKTRKEI